MSPPESMATDPPTTLAPIAKIESVSPSGSVSLASNWVGLMPKVVLTSPCSESSTATGGRLPGGGGGGGGRGGWPLPSPWISSDQAYRSPSPARKSPRWASTTSFQVPAAPSPLNRERACIGRYVPEYGGEPNPIGVVALSSKVVL